MHENHHYFVEVLGTIENDDRSTEQTWGSYIVTEPSAGEAALNCVKQYASMRQLDAYRPIVAHVRDEATMEVTETFSFKPQAAESWIADAKGQKWQVPTL